MGDDNSKLTAATSLAALGRFEECTAILDALPPEDRTAPPVLLLRARLAAQQGRLDEAERYCSALESGALDGNLARELAEVKKALTRAHRRGANRLVRLAFATALVAALAILAMASYAVGRQTAYSELRHAAERLDERLDGLQRSVSAQSSVVQTLGDSLKAVFDSTGEALQDQLALTQNLLERNERLDGQLRTIDGRMSALAASGGLEDRLARIENLLRDRQ